MAMAAELQERRNAERGSEPVGKPFMYGIADPDGNAYIDEFCGSEDLGLVEDTVNELNYDREEGDELNYSVVALYRHAQQPVVPDALADAFIAAIEKEQDRLHEEDYLMDSKDCIDVIREEVQRLNANCITTLTVSPQEVK
ncbi:hypothetical protein [Klebsiella michiganensis]|nr:hypothetical protein [Klebsiella michiganensis]NNS02769.1 hypothetical protein [Klebsiella michiganensis]